MNEREKKKECVLPIIIQREIIQEEVRESVEVKVKNPCIEMGCMAGRRNVKSNSPTLKYKKATKI